MNAISLELSPVVFEPEPIEIDPRPANGAV
jgi:hypothetical protein